MILLISNTKDFTTDFVVQEISRRSLPFTRLNTDEFPTLAYGTISINDGYSRRTIHWKNRNHVLDFEQVTAVLYRRPVPPVPDEAIIDPGIRRFCIDESYDFLRGLWLSLKCHWISNPEAIRKAEHKVYQLGIAQNLPFLIPKTLITNDPSETRAFFKNCSNGIIIKPLYLGFVNSAEGDKNIFTSLVSKDDLNEIESICLAPSIFQERVIKNFDIRVTIVGDELFVAKIETDSLPPNIPDWRFAPIQKLHHSEYKLPLEIESACFELVKRLGLDFGAIDLAVDNKGRYVFFEINPNGQWAWLETTLGFPISKAIVDRLLIPPVGS